jgi:hypothetical protein
MLSSGLNSPLLSRSASRITNPKSGNNSSNSSREVSSDSDHSDHDSDDIEHHQDEMRRLEEYINRKLSWNNLSLSEKMSLINKWAIVALVGNLMTTFGCIFYLLEGVFYLATIEIFLGFGCFCTWCSFTRYFENTKDFNLISRTFAVAIPVLLRTLLGIAPTFMGFTFLGMCLFWPFQEKFGSFS